MSYRNIQGMRAIAALMVLSSHLFWSLVPMRSHWAKPYFSAVGPSGVDMFFVISGFIIYHVMQRSIGTIEASGRGRAVLAFAMKRFIRIYPLYWVAFIAGCGVLAWAPPTALPRQKSLFELLTLVDGIPNYVVNVAWSLAYEVYFYAVAAVSLLILGRRAAWGLAAWFGLVAVAVAVGVGLGSPWREPFDYLFAPILLEFSFGVAVAMLVERGVRRLHGAMLPGAVAWMAAASYLLWENPAFPSLRVLGWGVPAAVLIYAMVVLEVRRQWIMPRTLQYLGDASFSLYLWHMIVYDALAGIFVRLGWVGTVPATALAGFMAVIGVGVGLLSYHWLEKPLLRHLGQRFLGHGVASHSLGSEVRAGNLAG
jgi:peptidoglycan/LPS O-acetylase OafA/YrhL